MLADDGETVGVDGEIRREKSPDAYLRRLNDVLKDRLDPPPVGGQVHIAFETVNDNKVAVVSVARSTTAVWMTPFGKSEAEFYVRANSASQKLDARRANAYITSTFPRH